MPRTLPLLALIAVVALAGCLGGFGLGPSSDTTATTTKTATETPTSAPAATTTRATTTTTTQPTTTQPPQTTSTTIQATTQQPTETTTMWTRTTARVDAPNGSKRFEARVVEVVDAETVKVKRESGETMVVSLLGIQTPSTNASASQFKGVPSSTQGRQLLATIHKRALQTTRSQLGNQVVTVVTDPAVSSDDSQQHAYVYVGEFMYNTQLLRTGYAQVSGSEFSKRQQFLQKQQTARQKGYGLWRNTTA